MNTFYTWRTSKHVTGGFEFRVMKVTSLLEPLEDGSYAVFTTVQSGVCKTRAIAKSQAQKWMRHLTQQAKVAA